VFIFFGFYFCYELSLEINYDCGSEVNDFYLPSNIFGGKMFPTHIPITFQFTVG